MDPKQPVFLVSVDFFNVDRDRQMDLALEDAIIDLHGDCLNRTVFLAFRFRHVAHPANRDVPIAHRQIDLRPIDASKLNADEDATFASVGIDRRLPGRRGKVWKTGAGKLRRDVVQSAV